MQYSIGIDSTTLVRLTSMAMRPALALHRFGAAFDDAKGDLLVRPDHEPDIGGHDDSRYIPRPMTR